ncbi:hypothetical protein DM860_006205 [Cuscuta australis]|uniref:SOSEKI DIX-like domain-containing protein n=2 Tax=Cuscuta sect. Cleistogrammica TaxID=1824901 RepID=A0A328DPA7_9ASTE|nr:hypothetical protein DM860_006205 [Cuscuta australis]
MEGRIKKYRPLSPDRAKVWTEKSPKYRQKQQPQREEQSCNNNNNHSSRIAVVYYLCRNRQLEHPHFIEVSPSSPDGRLYLRDVIERLNVLRGRGMASLYSWSCKRSYKNGFVWHDLSEDDLILPAHGNEYVLKGSELMEDSSLGHLSPARIVKIQNPKLLPEPPSARSQDDSSSSSSMNGRGSKPLQDDEFSPTVERPNSSGVSPESKNSSWNGSFSMTECKNISGLADASTQTEDNPSRNNSVRETCTRGISTDDGSSEAEGIFLISNGPEKNEGTNIKESSEIGKESVSPHPSSSSVSSGGRTDTLESLLRSDVGSKLNSFRVLGDEEFRVPTTKIKPSNMLMQLISCGSVSVKDNSFGIVPMYKPRFSHSKFSSPLYSTTSLSLGELDCLAENPRLMGVRLEDKEYFSGSLIETNVPKGVAALKRSSSFNADRTNKELDSVEDREDMCSAGTKCIPLSITASFSRHPRSESMRSPLSVGPRMSSSEGRITPDNTSRGASKRITEPLGEADNAIKIEES